MKSPCYVTSSSEGGGGGGGGGMEYQPFFILVGTRSMTHAIAIAVGGLFPFPPNERFKEKKKVVHVTLFPPFFIIVGLLVCTKKKKKKKKRPLYNKAQNDESHVIDSFQQFAFRIDDTNPLLSFIVVVVVLLLLLFLFFHFTFHLSRVINKEKKKKNRIPIQMSM